MWLTIQSVYNGTWGGGAVPKEIIDFEICREMHLSWPELQETPAYVQRVWWDCIQARREAEEEAQERQRSNNEGVQRVRR